jgi:hypothetical protein
VALARNATRAMVEATGDGLEPSTPAPWTSSVGGIICECDADAMVVACISERMMMIGKELYERD